MDSKIQAIFENCRKQNKKILNYEESRKILSLANITLNRVEYAKDIESCIEKANQIGYPIVLKIISEDVIHKSDSGGVKVGIKSDNDLREAFDEMLSNVKNFYPNAVISGFSVEEMVEGVELLIGTNTDEQFGKMIALGIGGIFVEIYKDVVFRLIPVSANDVEEMISEIKGKEIFNGFRGLPKVNKTELIEFIIKISTLISNNQNIKEMDLNPVVATKQGLKAIDARIILE